MTWLQDIAVANKEFQNRIDINLLPTERKPCPNAVITCMDPRVNLEAIGIPGFSDAGDSDSQVCVIRTIGAIHENRSILIGIHLAGFKELTVLMHTDCGCCLAHSKIDLISANLRETLSTSQLNAVNGIVGDPMETHLSDWLHTFEDPRVAVAREVRELSQSPFVPGNVIIHGLVYDVHSGSIEIVVDGYQ